MREPLPTGDRTNKPCGGRRWVAQRFWQCVVFHSGLFEEEYSDLSEASSFRGRTRNSKLLFPANQSRSELETSRRAPQFRDFAFRQTTCFPARSSRTDTKITAWVPRKILGNISQSFHLLPQAEKWDSWILIPSVASSRPIPVNSAPLSPLAF